MTRKAWDYLKRENSLTHKSLGYFRFALGVTLIINLIMRAQDTFAHYSASGLASEHFDFSLGGIANYSILGWFDSQLWIVAVFVLGLIFYSLFTFGYRTKLFGWLSLVILVSLQSRFYLGSHSGDELLRVVLFWSLLLPVQYSFSIDSVRKESAKNDRSLSLATIGYTVQIAVIYFVAFKSKSGDLWVNDFTAVQQIFNIEYLTYGTANFLAQFTVLLKMSTIAALASEWLIWVLLLIPIFTHIFRYKALVIAIILHLCILFTLRVGIFPIISIVAMLPFAPDQFWRHMGRFSRNKQPSKFSDLDIYYDQDCRLCTKIIGFIQVFLPLRNVQFKTLKSSKAALQHSSDHDSWVARRNGKYFVKSQAFFELMKNTVLVNIIIKLLGVSQKTSKLGDRLYTKVASNRAKVCKPNSMLDRLNFFKKWYQFVAKAAAQVVAVLFVVGLVGHNLNPYVGFIEPVNLGSTINNAVMRQSWSVFAVNPPSSEQWLVAKSITENGVEIDPWEYYKTNKSQSTLTYQPPKDIYDTYINSTWQKYLENITADIGSPEYQKLTNFVCRNWNDNNNDPINAVEFLVFSKLVTTPDYRQTASYGEPSRVLYFCLDG